MSIRIEAKAARNGDLLRMEYRDNKGRKIAVEWWNDLLDGELLPIDGMVYFLIERAVVLPTEPGYYESGLFPIVGNSERQYSPYQLAPGGKWTLNNASVTMDYMANVMPIKRLKFVYDE